MSHLAYLAVLALILLGTGWLEVALRTRVYRRWIRLVLTITPVLVVFTLWDLYAISAGHWSFDPGQTTGVVIFGKLPLEELLFFVVVPIASILTFEAVRSATGWPAGDDVAHTAADTGRIR